MPLVYRFDTKLTIDSCYVLYNKTNISSIEDSKTGLRMFNDSIKLICVYMRCKRTSVSVVNSKLLQNGLFD